MLNTLVTPSCEIVAALRLPCTENTLTPAFILPATRLASPKMVWPPVRYVPDAIVWLLVPGVIVAAALVVTDAVSDTDELPAVPLETYPAVTLGVTETVFESVKVLVPVDTLALVPLIVAGAVADPLDTDLVALLA